MHIRIHLYRNVYELSYMARVLKAVGGRFILGGRDDIYASALICVCACMGMLSLVYMYCRCTHRDL